MIFDDPFVTAVLIFAFTYVALAVGRIPGLRSDRVAAVVVGAALMVATGVLTFAEAQAAVDGRTIALLFGMMLVSAALDVSGAFAVLGFYVMRRAKTPLTLLVAVSAAAAVLSAMMINDVVCLAFTPLVLRICSALEREPKPYLIALATSSNIGSVATITGNPQNILIASLSHISYRHFAVTLAPLALVALAANIAVIFFTFRKELATPFTKTTSTKPPPAQRRELIKGMLVTAAVLVAFVVGTPPELAAILGGSAMLLTRATEPKRLYEHVDWTLLALFAGLFVVVRGAEHAGVADRLLAAFTVVRTDTISGLAGVAALLSNLVSNVPAVMVLKASVPHLAHPEAGWFTLAMASTFAGNLTLAGSLATIIVVERAKERTTISFADFLRVGLPTGLITLALGVPWLMLREMMAF